VHQSLSEPRFRKRAGARELGSEGDRMQSGPNSPMQQCSDRSGGKDVGADKSELRLKVNAATSSRSLWARPTLRTRVGATFATRYSTAAGSSEASSISAICAAPWMTSCTGAPPAWIGSETTA
jgi:hypothetical protein